MNNLNLSHILKVCVLLLIIMFGCKFKEQNLNEKSYTDSTLIVRFKKYIDFENIKSNDTLISEVYDSDGLKITIEAITSDEFIGALKSMNVDLPMLFKNKRANEKLNANSIRTSDSILVLKSKDSTLTLIDNYKGLRDRYFYLNQFKNYHIIPCLYFETCSTMFVNKSTLNIDYTFWGSGVSLNQGKTLLIYYDYRYPYWEPNRFVLYDISKGGVNELFCMKSEDQEGWNLHGAFWVSDTELYFVQETHSGLSYKRCFAKMKFEISPVGSEM